MYKVIFYLFETSRAFDCFVMKCKVKELFLMNLTVYSNSSEAAPAVLCLLKDKGLRNNWKQKSEELEKLFQS